MKRFICFALILSLIPSGARAAQSTWVHFDSSGNLVYFKDDLSNRILDFSYAGYHGGGVKLPSPAVKVTVSPGSGDDTSRIQSAISSVAAMTPDANGFRGAV